MGNIQKRFIVPTRPLQKQARFKVTKSQSHGLGSISVRTCVEGTPRFEIRTNNRKFDCGIHTCEKRCHPQDPQTISCPRSPENVKFCPCGKTLITDLIERTTCQDPIPVCKETCSKLLPCGHTCTSPCHLDACPPCHLLMTTKCRCGQSTFPLPCSQIGQQELLCERVSAEIQQASSDTAA